LCVREREMCRRESVYVCKCVWEGESVGERGIERERECVERLSWASVVVFRCPHTLLAIFTHTFYQPVAETELIAAAYNSEYFQKSALQLFYMVNLKLVS